MNFGNLRPPQLECVKNLDGATLVCAGAGSGKTLTLTKRVAWALSPGSGVDGEPFLKSVDDLLVITFTEKAAGEIKARVRTGLRAEGMNEEALRVDGAWISTIHGMCSRILHEHALELQLDPSFEVLTKEEGNARMIAALDEELANHEENYRPLFDEYGVGAKDLALELLKEASHLTAGLDAFDEGPAPTTVGNLLFELEAAYRAVADLASGKTASDAEDAADTLRALSSSEDAPNTAASLFVSLPNLRRGKSEDVNGAIDDLHRLLYIARLFTDQAVSRPLLDLLLHLARTTQSAYEAAKRVDGVLSMDEMVGLTLSAFKEHPRIHQCYADRFKLVMVDEFQDTNQLQIDLIQMMTGSNNERLCTVGDSQQSIYRFQGADVNVYLQHKTTMQSPPVNATYIEMFENFRSHPAILDAVRTVCDTPNFFSEPFLDLTVPVINGKRVHGEDDFFGKHRLNIIAAKGKRIDDARRAGAEALAQCFADLRDAGHQAGQMVVLLRATSSAPLYMEALRKKNFDCVLSGGSGFFKAEEVQLCQCILSVLGGARDDAALFALLASDILPVTSDDLIELGTGQRTDEESGVTVDAHRSIAKAMLTKSLFPANASPLLVHARTVLWRALDAVGTLRPDAVMRRFIVESGWLARLQNGGASGMAAAANVLKYLELLADVADRKHFGMALCLSEMKAMENEDIKYGALTGDAGNAVRFLTVHASKGLQFPIVAVAEFADPSGHSSSLITHTAIDTCRVALRRPSKKAAKQANNAAALIDEDTLDAHADNAGAFVASLVHNQQVESAYERNRLFYVAATRAEEALFFVVPYTSGTSGVYETIERSFFGDAGFPDHECCVTCTEGAEMHFIPAAPPDEQEECNDAAPAATTVELFHLDESTPCALAPVATERGFYSYSSLASHSAATGNKEAAEEKPASTSPQQEDASTKPAPDADKATDFGTALHLACEWLALNPQADEAQCEQTLKRISAQFSLRDGARLEKAFSSWISSPVKAEAFAFDNRQPEVPFCVAVGDEFLEGEIDLLCYNSGGKEAFIVDYKTGGSDDETAEDLQRKHLLQAQCYAYATMKSGFESVQLSFVRVERRRGAEHKPQVVTYSFTEHDLDDLFGLVSDARSSARG